MNNRASGILLHITSLPSEFGIGDLGPEAYRFVDWLRRARQTFWQVLPHNPTEAAFGYSPYSVPSSYAGNPLLISPQILLERGLLEEADLSPRPTFPRDGIDFGLVARYKGHLLQVAFQRFRRQGGPVEFETYCTDNAHWLDDYALFASLKSRYGGLSWNLWPEPVRDRDPDTLSRLAEELREEMDGIRFAQYLFADQWGRLRSHLHSRGVEIIGDLPIYVNYDSVDTWADPGIFLLDEDRNPVAVAGVPPDHYSSTGQLWGNPLYRWDVLKETGYRWWIERLEHALGHFDRLRLDHFRGLVAYWEVPFGENTAIGGRWVGAPADDFLAALERIGLLRRIIAEDLGTITPDVRRIIGRFGLPGMKVLYFAFGDADPMHPYLPHTYPRNCVVYTGTHDNSTIRGWYELFATAEEKKRLVDYLGRDVTADDVSWELIRVAMMSVADLTIFPMQDVLGLGDDAAMNRPATVKGNWLWRLIPGYPDEESAGRLGRMTETYGRAPRSG
ncbi:MAG: 4-alpha-glucanotransferase [bacterium]|nr:MAG: 4-alpha-glucanotransferase [bacterium]